MTKLRDATPDQLLEISEQWFHEWDWWGYSDFYERHWLYLLLWKALPDLL